MRARTPIAQRLLISIASFLLTFTMLELARRIEVILATFAYSALFTDEPRVSSEEYVGALEETNETARTIAKETGVHLFDFAAVFPKDRRYYFDGRHVTEEGARLQAELFARYIVERGLVPKDARE